jgi:hypothetical protein
MYIQYFSSGVDLTYLWPLHKLGVGRNALHLMAQYHPRSRARRSIRYSVVKIRGRRPWRLTTPVWSGRLCFITDERIGMEAKTSSLKWNNQGEKHSTVNVTERSKEHLFPSFVAPRRSCVVRRAMVVIPVADGTHSMMEKLG